MLCLSEHEAAACSAGMKHASYHCWAVGVRFPAAQTSCAVQTAEVYRKLRFTLRYLLGNLADYEPSHSVPVRQLPLFDRQAPACSVQVCMHLRSCRHLS